jgi:hypothetical protein
MYGVDTSAFLEAKRNGTRIVICTGAYANIVDGVSRTLNRLVKDLNDGSDGDNYKVGRAPAFAVLGTALATLVPPLAQPWPIHSCPWHSLGHPWHSLGQQCGLM